jgi:ParB-like nuclease domain
MYKEGKALTLRIAPPGFIVVGTCDLQIGNCLGRSYGESQTRVDMSEFDNPSHKGCEKKSKVPAEEIFLNQTASTKIYESFAADEKNWDLSQFPIIEIKMAKENDQIYDRFSTDSFDDQALIESVRSMGVLEPLVISLDQVLLSGHRRLSAARSAGLLHVPVRLHPIKYRSLAESDRLKLLSDFNYQREKTPSEKINEAFVRTDPVMATFEIEYLQLERKSKLSAAPKMNLGAKKLRHQITTTNFLDAVKRVVRLNEKYWPLTDRRVHYLLLNDPPLRHNKKPSSHYANDKASYKALTNLLTRARLTGEIPITAIEDSTRPVQLGNGFQSVYEYIAQETNSFLIGYRRDLQIGQQNHIEIILEKNALRTVIEEVADEFCIPMTTSRGYLSLPPKAAILDRFRRSGRKTLVLLFLTDFDPDGDEIARSTARSLRDDFGLKDSEIHAEKVALTLDDIEENELPSDMEAKTTSPNYKKFFQSYKTGRVVELDAAPVELLQEKLRDAIEQHMDVDEFNRQIEIMQDDNRHIIARRQIVLKSMGG